MLDRQGLRRDSDIESWEWHWNAPKPRCPGHFSPVRQFDMPFVRHDNDMEYLRNFRHLIARVDDFRRMNELELNFVKRPYKNLYSI